MLIFPPPHLQWAKCASTFWINVTANRATTYWAFLCLGQFFTQLFFCQPWLLMLAPCASFTFRDSQNQFNRSHSGYRYSTFGVLPSHRSARHLVSELLGKTVPESIKINDIIGIDIKSTWSMWPFLLPIYSIHPTAGLRFNCCQFIFHSAMKAWARFVAIVKSEQHKTFYSIAKFQIFSALFTSSVHRGEASFLEMDSTDRILQHPAVKYCKQISNARTYSELLKAVCRVSQSALIFRPISMTGTGIKFTSRRH